MHPICRQYRFCGEYGSPRRRDRCPRSGASKPSTEKASNEPKLGYALMIFSQGVNLDAFGFAYYKRTQFRWVDPGWRVAACLPNWFPNTRRARGRNHGSHRSHGSENHTQMAELIDRELSEQIVSGQMDLERKRPMIALSAVIRVIGGEDLMNGAMIKASVRGRGWEMGPSPAAPSGRISNPGAVRLSPCEGQKTVRGRRAPSSRERARGCRQQAQKAGLVQDARPSGNSSGRHDGGGVPQRLGPVAARRARWQLPPPSPRRPRGPAPPVARGRILKPFRPMLLGLDSRAARKASPVQEVEYSIQAIPSPRLRSDTITTRALRISRTRSLPPRDRVPVAVAARRVGAHPPTGLPRPTFPVRYPVRAPERAADGRPTPHAATFDFRSARAARGAAGPPGRLLPRPPPAGAEGRVGWLGIPRG